MLDILFRAIKHFITSDAIYWFIIGMMAGYLVRLVEKGSGE
jgi:hypothetical protein